jgi:hypothetical protein
MPLLDQIRAQKLIELAHARWVPDPNDAELKVLRDSASPLDPDLPAADAQRPLIRADFVRWLATDPETTPYIDPKGLRIAGVNFLGTLDLQNCHIPVPLTFMRCLIDGEVVLQSAETKGFFMLDSWVKGAFRGDFVSVGGPLYLKGTSFSRNVLLLCARITGDLNCAGAKLHVGQGYALAADGADIGGSVFLNAGFEASGTVTMVKAHIKGQLNFTDAKLKVAEEDSLRVDQTEVGGSAYLCGDFESSGRITMTRTNVNGDLNCDNAKLSVTQGDALNLEGALIKGNVFLRGKFQSSGTIRLMGAQIKGQFNCNGAKLLAPGWYSIYGDWVSIGMSAFLNGEFESSGELRLLGATVVGELNFCGAKVAGVRCPNICVTGDFDWRGVQKSDGAFLDLDGAKIGNIRDDRDSWPAQDRLSVNGLVYAALSLHPRATPEEIKENSFNPAPPVSARDRIDWLMLQPASERDQPQPWLQLSAQLNTQGDQDGAKHVLYKLKCLQAENSKPLARRWAITFAWLEEAPVRICWSIAAFLILGWMIFGHAGATGALAPTDSGAYAAFTGGKPMPAAYPTLNPFVYTLDNSVPLVKLGQDDKWAPDRSHAATDIFTGYWFLMWTRWMLILLGWFQASALGAALSGIFKQ